MYGYVYKTTNNLNNKIYIGQHKSSVFDDKYIGSGKILLQAITKYGKDNFTTEVLEWCDSREQLNEKEKFCTASCEVCCAALGRQGANRCTGKMAAIEFDSFLPKIVAECLINSNHMVYQFFE